MQMIKYILYSVIIAMYFSIVVAEFDQRMYASKLCTKIQDTFRSAKEVFKIVDLDGNCFYCVKPFCLAPDYAFSIWLEVYQDFRYTECIQDIYQEVHNENK